MYPRLLVHADSLFVFLWLDGAVRIAECRLWLWSRIIWDTKQGHKPSPYPLPNHQLNTRNLCTRPLAKYRHDSNSPYSWGGNEGCIIWRIVAVPLQAWSGPEGFRKLRFPDYMTTAQDGGKVASQNCLIKKVS